MSRPPPPPPPPPPPYLAEIEARRRRTLRADTILVAVLIAITAAVIVGVKHTPPEPALRLIVETPEGCRIYQPRAMAPVVICPAGWAAVP